MGEIARSRQPGPGSSVCRRPKLTPRGWGFVVVCCIAVFAGIIFGEIALIQISLFGILILLASRFLAIWNLKNVRVTKSAPEYVFAKQDFFVELSVTSDAARFDSFQIEVTDAMLPRQDRGLIVPSVRPGDFARNSFETRIVKRGLKDKMQYKIRSSFPLGFFTVEKTAQWSRRITVFPRPVIPDALRNYLETEMREDGVESMFKPDREGDFRSVREFRPGDPIKLIHWRATARVGKLLVREFDRPMPRKYTVLYHAYAPPGQLIWPEAFEHAMELLAGLLVYCRTQQIPLTLHGAFNNWQALNFSSLRDLTQPLEILAKASFRQEKSFDELAKAVNGITGSQVVFIVSATPVGLWEHLVPECAHRVICLDNSGMRIRPVKPRLSMNDLRGGKKSA